MNIICLGGRVMEIMVAWDRVDAFLTAEFSHAERHLRRLSKVAALEKKTVGEIGAATAAIPMLAAMGAEPPTPRSPGESQRLILKVQKFETNPQQYA